VDSRTVSIHRISPWAALRVTAIVFGVLIVLRFLWIAHAIFVVTFLGMLLGLAMARGVDFLQRLRIPRGIGAPLVLLAFLGTMAGLFAMIGPSIAEQSRELGKELPKALKQIEQWVNRTPAKALVQQAPEQQQQQQQPQQQQQQEQKQPQQQQKPGQSKEQQQQQEQGGLSAQLGKELRGATKFLFPIVSSIFGAIGGLVIVLFIAMYIAAAPGLYREGMLHLVPHRHRARAEEWLSTLADTLRQWLVARLIAMVVIGLITGGGLALLNVKGAAALGVLAGLLEFVPFFGPIASAIPAIGIALVDSPQKALYVLGLYLVIQQLEGNVITPLLLEKRLDIPPVMTVVAVAALGMVFGVIGMLIAEPLLAVILVTTKMLYVTDVVGDEVKIGKEES
jgi:predicted PurR-regulated permease PerM